MLVVISKDRLEALLKEEIKCWEGVSGGPNPNAFFFDPKEIDPQMLREAGYYDNVDAWVAGVRIKQLIDFLADLDTLPTVTGKK